MKCQHEWRYVPASNIKYGYYTCQKCDADMSETQYEAIQQAHREGWERGKKQADSLLLDLVDVVLESKPVVQSARRAIADMEYKEKAND